MDSKVWYIPARNDRLEKKVGIYCRVSTNEKEQLYSLAAQISCSVQLLLPSLDGIQLPRYIVPRMPNGVSSD